MRNQGGRGHVLVAQGGAETIERFVERFRYKASKARQAQSKLKQIERIKMAVKAKV